MRALVLLVVLALSIGTGVAFDGQLAGASPYAPDIPLSRQIVPGVRIGSWTLAMDIAGLTRVLGRPAAAAPRSMFDQQPGLTGHAWTIPDGTLIAWSADRRTIAYLELRDNRTYRTAKQIGVGSTSLEVQAAYGAPSTRTAIPGASRYIYDPLGLAVFTQGTSSGFIAVAVDVFLPGAAATLWKF